MKLRGLFTIIVSMALFITLIAPLQGHAAEKQLFRIGAGILGSAGHIHWEAVSHIVNENSNMLKTSSFSTAGSRETVYLLDQKKIEIGTGTAFEVTSANDGTAPFDQKYQVWQIFGWNMVHLPMIARADDTSINTYMDLAGKRVSLIKKGSGAESLYEILLTSLGIYDDVQKNYLTFPASFDALVDGIIVASPASMPDGIPLPQVQDLASRIDYKILNITQEEIDKVTAINSAITARMLPKSAYEKMTEDQLVPSFASLGLSGPHVDDDTIYEFTKTVMENLDTLRSISKSTTAMTLENAVDWMVQGYPVHPGAARYFKEKGVWRDDLVVGQR